MSFSLTILAWILAILVCIITALILYTTWNYGKLNGLGFPVIPPYWIFGSNYMEPYRVQTELYLERHEKYGMIFGAYDGRTPVIYIADPKISRQIRLVDSESFRNHNLPFGNGPIVNEVLDLLKDEKWKFVRSTISPFFTSGKIKLISQIVKTIGDKHAKDLANTSQNGYIEKFNMQDYASPLLIESLLRAFCGIEIGNARDPNNEFIKKTQIAFDTVRTEDWRTTLYKMFPFLLCIFGFFDFEEMDFFVSVVKSSLETKLKSGLNSEKSHEAAGILAEMLHKLRQNDPKYKFLGINENTIVAQGWEAFVASYNAFLDALITLSYELANHPEIQEKLYEELTNVSTSSEDLADESKVPYTTAVVMEILRLHVQFDKPERHCNETWTFEGITIPKGSQVRFPISAIHLNPKYYPEPMSFKPERFLDKSKFDPNVYLSFGQGPRQCYARRFALEMLKIFLISFVLKFKIVKRSDTEYVKKPGSLLTVAMKPIFVDLIVR